MAARQQAFTPKNIASSFCNTRLIPADGSIVLRKQPSTISQNSPLLTGLQCPQTQAPPVVSQCETLRSQTPESLIPPDNPSTSLNIIVHSQASPSDNCQSIKTLRSLNAKEIHNLSKRKNLENLEGKRKVPKRRKTKFQLEEEESPLCKEIQEAQIKIEGLEQHVNDLHTRIPESTDTDGGYENGLSEVDGSQRVALAMPEEDHKWDRNEVDVTPTPVTGAPSGKMDRKDATALKYSF
ncbi:hypothetical protein HOY82DRAFT_618586 [Tuber indicum]|nr:hypothetical protein HOY82DRAFT_618586 [Tuber indicum]